MKNSLLAACLLMALPVLAQTVNPNIENITPDSRYTVHNDGTVTDTETGLMWQQCSLGQTWESIGGAGNCSGTAIVHNWGGALMLANNESFAEYSDWRLPNIKELASLVAEDRYNPAINSAIFPATPSSSFWSGTAVGESSLLVDFRFGIYNNLDRSMNNHVRLVRSAQ